MEDGGPLLLDSEQFDVAKLFIERGAIKPCFLSRDTECYTEHFNDFTPLSALSWALYLR